MAEQPRSEIIKDNPIGNGLNAFRASFNTLCTNREIPCTFDVLGQLDLEGRISSASMPYAFLTSIDL